MKVGWVKGKLKKKKRGFYVSTYLAIRVKVITRPLPKYMMTI